MRKSFRLRLTSKLEAKFKDWKTGEINVMTLPNAPVRDKAAIYIVDKPGAAQSVISIGQVGVSRDNPDYFPLQVMNTILGSGFTSRINMNLREDKGLQLRSAFRLFLPARRGAVYGFGGRANRRYERIGD
jgi:predicted Zn-dependent peptidase